MSEKHSIICDSCQQSDEAEYNGEHWLPPKGWATLVDSNFCSGEFGQHLCPKCISQLGTAREGK